MFGFCGGCARSSTAHCVCEFQKLHTKQCALRHRAKSWAPLVAGSGPAALVLRPRASRSRVGAQPPRDLKCSSTNASVPRGKFAHGGNVGNRTLARPRIGIAASVFLHCLEHRRSAGYGSPEAVATVSARAEAFGHHAAPLGVTEWRLVWGSMTRHRQ